MVLAAIPHSQDAVTMPDAYLMAAYVAVLDQSILGNGIVRDTQIHATQLAQLDLVINPQALRLAALTARLDHGDE